MYAILIFLVPAIGHTHLIPINRYNTNNTGSFWKGALVQMHINTNYITNFTVAYWVSQSSAVLAKCAAPGGNIMKQ
jgi:hypothetical protein